MDRRGTVYRKSEKQKQKERIVITRMRKRNGVDKHGKRDGVYKHGKRDGVYKHGKRDGVDKHGKRNCEATKIVLIDLFKMKIKRGFCLAKF